MKHRSKIQKMCAHCFTVKKRGKSYVYCNSDPRHKQRQKFGFLTSSILDPSISYPMLQNGYIFNSFGLGLQLRSFMAPQEDIY